MSLNIELAEQILTQITEHPETHYQGKWHCGTTMCIAGFACHFAGDEFVRSGREWGDLRVREGGDPDKVRLVWLRAEELLGISGERLFYLTNEDAVATLGRLIDEAKTRELVHA